MTMDQLFKLYGLLLTVAITVTYVTHCNFERKLGERHSSQTVFALTVWDTFGQPVEMKRYQGHVLLIVNIASHCGHTVLNYAGLTNLKKSYESKGLRILNFPCNQFAQQMPIQNGKPMLQHLKEANAEIGDIFARIQVNGKLAHPLYKLLARNKPIEWNFVKFLIDRNGLVYRRYAPDVDPKYLKYDIELLLNKQEK